MNETGNNVTDPKTLIKKAQKRALLFLLVFLIFGIALITCGVANSKDNVSTNLDKTISTSIETPSTATTIINSINTSLSPGYYYISKIGSEIISPSNKCEGFIIESNKSSITFIPVEYEKELATKVDSKELSFSTTMNEKYIIVKNQIDPSNIWTLEPKNNALSGTVIQDGNSYDVELLKYPITEISLIDDNSVFDSKGMLISENEIKDLDWKARINLSDEGALKGIVHTLGMEIYKIAKKNQSIKAIRVSLYYTDLNDKYGKAIAWKDALDSTFIIDGLDEVRKYKDGLTYALEYEVILAHFVLSGKYSSLWRN